MRAIEAPDAPSAAGGYAQAAEVIGARRLLFISGQIPVTSKGRVPEGFEEQARLVWGNVQAQLRAAGMTLANVVKVTTFLSDRSYADQNREVREAVLGTCRPALTVIIADIFDEAWLLEIEVVAAAG